MKLLPSKLLALHLFSQQVLVEGPKQKSGVVGRTVPWDMKNTAFSVT